MLWVVWIGRQHIGTAGEYQRGLTGKRARRPVDATKRRCGQPGLRNLTTAGPQQSPQDKSQLRSWLGHRRIIDSIAWISDRSDASSFTRWMIFWTAEITVVWCLPPNARARSGYESLVWWREMYIATARGVATDLWRRSDLMSLGLRP